MGVMWELIVKWAGELASLDGLLSLAPDGHPLLQPARGAAGRLDRRTCEPGTSVAPPPARLVGEFDDVGVLWRWRLASLPEECVLAAA